jgi:hypothetical protein
VDAKGFTVNVADLVIPAAVTEMVTVVGTAAGVVMMRNPVAAAPPGTMTPAPTLATAGLLLDSEMAAPSGGAGDASVITPEEPAVPVTEVGVSVTDAGGTGGVKVSWPWTVLAFQLAVMVARVSAATELVVTLNDTDRLPGATVTVGGTPTEFELLTRLTTAPPAGAVPLSMITAPGVPPPLMRLGVTDNPLSEGGLTVKETDAEEAPSEAVTVTGVAAVT